jgi:signal transduction histidine kinase
LRFVFLRLLFLCALALALLRYPVFVFALTGYNDGQMKLPPLFGSFRGWWFIVALVVGPAIVLAALGLRALSLERMGREQELWREQSRLVLLVDSAVSNALSAIEGKLRRGESELIDDPSLQGEGKSVPFIRFVFDRNQILIFPDDRVFFGEVGRRPPQASAFSLFRLVVQFIEQAQEAEARKEDKAALSAYQRIRTLEPRLRPWVDLNIARIQYGHREAELPSALRNIDLTREDSISPSGIPVAMLACYYAEQLSDDRRAAFEGLFRQTLTSLRNGRWWLAGQQRAFYDEELVRLLRSVRIDDNFPEEKDARLDVLGAIEKSVRQSPPRGHDAAAYNYNYTAEGGFLLLWSPAGHDQTWIGAAIRAERIGEWLKPMLTPLSEGLQFGVALRDSRQEQLWTDAAPDVPVARWERLRSIPEWELDFIAAPESTGIDPKRILWYGFILLPMVMLIVGIAAATRVVRKELVLGRMQSDFIAAVSHEFKSPLTSIRLLVERIAGRRHSSAGSIDEYCGAINNETGRLEKLVNRLLEWQQIEAGQKHYKLEPGSLVAVTRTAVELLRPQAEAKNVFINLKAEGKMPDILMDRAAMTDVMENLVDNAVKYSKAGGRVSIEVHTDDENVIAEVCDEGIGIAPEDLSRVFEKFYRGSRGNREDVRGTGLGLSLVKAAVDAHGGKVQVKSTPGQGSCFVLSLPIHREEEENAPDSDRG